MHKAGGILPNKKSVVKKIICDILSVAHYYQEKEKSIESDAE
jgi:hypothetical protein